MIEREPLPEDVEESWIVFMNRFDSVIYPTVFEPHGYTKGEALLAWKLARIEACLGDLADAIHEMRE